MIKRALVVLSALYLLLGCFISAHMFDYPVGWLWHVVVIVLWPLTLFMG